MIIAIVTRGRNPSTDPKCAIQLESTVIGRVDVLVTPASFEWLTASVLLTNDDKRASIEKRLEPYRSH